MARSMALCAYDGPDYFSVRSPGSRRLYIRSLRNKANPDDTFEAQLFMAT